MGYFILSRVAISDLRGDLLIPVQVDSTVKYAVSKRSIDMDDALIDGEEAIFSPPDGL